MSDAGGEGEPESGTEAIEQYLSRSPVLERVLEVNQALPAHGGARVVISSLELWTSRMIVHEIVTPGSSISRGDAAAREERRRRLSESRLHDDLGKIYPWSGGGGGYVSGLKSADSPLQLTSGWTTRATAVP